MGLRALQGNGRASGEALNSNLLECCRRRTADCLRGHDRMIGERLERDLAALQTPLPAPYDACESAPRRRVSPIEEDSIQTVVDLSGS